jgi:hypothetical protein
MGKLTIRIPDPLRRELDKLCRQEGRALSDEDVFKAIS